MLEIIALMKPVQLKESSVNEAIDTPTKEVTDWLSADDLQNLAFILDSD